LSAAFVRQIARGQPLVQLLAFLILPCAVRGAFLVLQGANPYRDELVDELAIRVVRSAENRTYFVSDLDAFKGRDGIRIQSKTY
jgi:hypothetical protein